MICTVRAVLNTVESVAWDTHAASIWEMGMFPMVAITITLWVPLRPTRNSRPNTLQESDVVAEARTGRQEWISLPAKQFAYAIIQQT